MQQNCRVEMLRHRRERCQRKMEIDSHKREKNFLERLVLPDMETLLFRQRVRGVLAAFVMVILAVLVFSGDIDHVQTIIPVVLKRYLL